MAVAVRMAKRNFIIIIIEVGGKDLRVPLLKPIAMRRELHCFASPPLLDSIGRR